MSKASEEQLDEVYRRGLEQGRKEAKFGPLLRDLPAFPPWTAGVRFQQTRSWFDGFVDFERGTTEDLRSAERARWTLEHARAKLVGEIEATAGGRASGAWERFGLTLPRRLRSSGPLRMVAARLPEAVHDLRAELEDCERELVLVERAQRLIRNQMHEVRRVVDGELEFGRGYACTVEAIRGAPTRPHGVHESRASRRSCMATAAVCTGERVDGWAPGARTMDSGGAWRTRCVAGSPHGGGCRGFP